MTFERLLVVVYSNVSDQIRLLCKLLRANRARVISDTIVNELMSRERTYLRVRLVANRARVILDSVVDSLMLNEITLPFERLSARGALEWLAF